MVGNTDLETHNGFVHYTAFDVADESQIIYATPPPTPLGPFMNSPTDAPSPQLVYPDTTCSGDLSPMDPPAFQRVPNDERLPSPSFSILSRSTSAIGRKSHARKRSEGHIPRPRNAFILFRCGLIDQGKVPQEYKDHSLISKHAGELWRSLSPAQREGWQYLAKIERESHLKMHKLYNYRYKPVDRPSRKKKQLRFDEPAAAGITPRSSPSGRVATPMPDTSFPRRRSSSCPPPGAYKRGEPSAFTFKDDSADQHGRRLSRSFMWHTTPAPAPFSPFGAPTMMPGGAYNPANQSFVSWEGNTLSSYYPSPMPNCYYNFDPSLTAQKFYSWDTSKPTPNPWEPMSPTDSSFNFSSVSCISPSQLLSEGASASNASGSGSGPGLASPYQEETPTFLDPFNTQQYDPDMLPIGNLSLADQAISPLDTCTPMGPLPGEH